jgi:hypothetical protein
LAAKSLTLAVVLFPLIGNNQRISSQEEEQKACSFDAVYQCTIVSCAGCREQMNPKKNEVCFAATKQMHASFELLRIQGSDLSLNKYNSQFGKEIGHIFSSELVYFR